MTVAIIAGVVVLLLLRRVRALGEDRREYQRIVLFRLGRAIGIRGPGLILVNPVTDRTTWVDLREQYLEIPRQTAITKDNASISIDFIIFYKVVDPSMLSSRSRTSPARRRTSPRRRSAASSATWLLTTCSPNART